MNDAGGGFGGALAGAGTGAGVGSIFGPVGTGIGAGIGALAGGLSSLWNTWQEAKTQNWQKQAQEITWQREDNAQQRAVADLRAAGLSPTLAAGHGAPTSSPTRLESPKLDAATVALSLMKMKADVSRTAAETRLINANASVAEATVPTRIGQAAQNLRLSDMEALLKSGRITAQEYENLKAKRWWSDVGNTGVFTRFESERTNNMANQARISAIEAELKEKYGDPAAAMGLTKEASALVGAVLQLMQSFKSK